jgi:predicted nucleotidyltransferase
MTTILKDISGKIEDSIVEAIELIDAIANQLGVQYFIVGAKARDLFFSAIYGIDTRRATLDVDIGIRAKNWAQAANLIDALIKSGSFEQNKKLQFRIKHSNELLVDVIPFGEVENPKGKITWPEDEKEMTTTGFIEAFESSLTLRLRDEPPLDVKICTPPALVVLKLIAWDENKSERSDDAIDILYILETYIDAGNDDRLYGVDDDLHDEDDFDYMKASARILGRDIVKIASQTTIDAVLKMLDRETDEISEYKLITDMNRSHAPFQGEYFESTLQLLLQLKKGILERIKS